MIVVHDSKEKKDFLDDDVSELEFANKKSEEFKISSTSSYRKSNTVDPIGIKNKSKSNSSTSESFKHKKISSIKNNNPLDQRISSNPVTNINNINYNIYNFSQNTNSDQGFAQQLSQNTYIPSQFSHNPLVYLESTNRNRQTKEYTELKETLKRKSIKSDIKINKFDLIDYHVIEELENGIFGKHYLAQHLKSQKFFMMIKINCDSKELSNLFSYYDLAYKNQNSNIQKVYASNIEDIDGINFCLSILCEDLTTDLESHINFMTEKKEKYLENDLLELMRQLITSLEILSKNGHANGRINPKNIYFTENDVSNENFKKERVRRNSFSSDLMSLNSENYMAKSINSKKNSKPTFNAKFTIPLLQDPLKWTFSNENLIHDYLRKNQIYLSPLLYSLIDKKNNSRGHNSEKSDIYSLGLCMLYASCLNTRPIYEIRSYKTNSDGIKNLVQKYLKLKYSNQYIEILLGMLSPEEKIRWSITKILESIDKIKGK